MRLGFHSQVVNQTLSSIGPHKTCLCPSFSKAPLHQLSLDVCGQGLCIEAPKVGPFLFKRESLTARKVINPMTQSSNNHLKFIQVALEICFHQNTVLRKKKSYMQIQTWNHHPWILNSSVGTLKDLTICISSLENSYPQVNQIKTLHNHFFH